MYFQTFFVAIFVCKKYNIWK